MLSTKIPKWFKHSIYIIAAFIIFIMLILTVITDLVSISLLTIPLSIILTLSMLYISIKLSRYNPRIYMIFLIFISLIIYLAWNVYAKTNPVSDYMVIFEGANKIVKGTFHTESFDKTSYFYIYNYQIGYTVYIALVQFIFGNNLIVYKILEGIYITCTSVVIYKISEKIWSRDCGAIASILFALFIPNILGSSIINNQHLSTLTLMLSIYFLLKDTKALMILSGILLAITQILRPISIIPIIAIIIVYIYRAMKEKNYRKYLTGFLIIIFSFTIITKAFDFTLVKLKLSPSAISNSNAKYFKFILGLKGNGVYNIPTESARKTQVYFDLETLNFDYDKYNELCLQILKESLKDYKNTLPYVKDKMIYFMSGKDNQYEFAIDQHKLNKYIYLLTDIGQVQYTLLLLFTLASLILSLKKGKSEMNIVYVLIIGFALVHIFIEVQTRYRYELYSFFSIVSAYSFSNLWCKVTKKEKTIEQAPLIDNSLEA